MCHGAPTHHNTYYIMCAKSKSFFGLRRGSTKSLTFQVLDGQQITKDRVTEVRNPRTEKQRIQRVIMNTALRAYSAMKEICDHSFEGIQYGGKSQQAFLAENIRAARMRLADKGDAFANEKAFTPLGQVFVAPNAYVISKGSLPAASYTLNGGLILAGGATYADMLAALRANPGDQLTICMLVGDSKPQNTRFVYGRVILMPQDESGQNLDLSSALVADGAIANPNLRNENTESFGFAVADGNLIITCIGATVHAAGVIISRKMNGSWLRSSQSMVFASPKIGFTLAEAIETSTSDIEVVDPYYLNNANAAEVTPVAGVASVLYNGSVVANGGSYEGGHTLVINGSMLSTAGIVLKKGSEIYVHASSTDKKVTYELSTPGSYRLEVNGDSWVAFTLVEPGQGPVFENVKWDGVDPKLFGNPVTVRMGSVSTLNMTLGAGVAASEVTSSSADLVISDATLSAGAYQAKVTVNGDGVISCRGQVIIAIKAEENSLPPAE